MIHILQKHSSEVMVSEDRGVATNWTGRARFKSGPFLYRKYKRGMKESNVYLLC